MNRIKYQEELIKAMEMLGQEHTIFIGQTVEYSGSPMFNSLIRVPKEKRLEFPVAEDTQMGVSIGLSLEGFIPVTIFPRIDFLICAVNQLVNHLDKIESMSQGEFTPGVIIRTQIGNTKPLNPGPQHTGDYTKGLKAMLKNVKVIRLRKSEEVFLGYVEALKRAKLGKSTLIIESPSGRWEAK